MKEKTSTTPIPLEQEVAPASGRRMFSIGLPRCNDATERRFPLTPESARILVDEGFTLRMESDAGQSIHYTDGQYSRAGVRVGSREEALGCDIVLHLAPLAPPDIRKMRRGAMLLTLFSLHRQTLASVRELLSRGIIAIALDQIGRASCRERVF